ncbi:MAG: toxin-antitoxin system HicB family antitoxin [Pirellulaceae bacterium]|nr:toxin-antitoxin system HicB family antitoxin [Pirellulaceae bacterium]
MADFNPDELHRCKREAYRVAAELYRQDPHWLVFMREMLGVGGVVRRLFPTEEGLRAFEETPEYQEIRQMLARLRARPDGDLTHDEPMRMITVRLPKSLHEVLKAEAHQKQLSMNKLCIAKLIQILELEETEELEELCREERRLRQSGPAGQTARAEEQEE